MSAALAHRAEVAHKPRLLFVDDDPTLLASIADLLYRSYDVVTAPRASAALAMLAHGELAIVVSDLRMPEMDGIAFLSEVRQRAPTTVRMLLTGHADLDAAVRAVNEGAIFRLLLKPCPPEQLHIALRDAVDQRRVLHADRDLLATRVEEMSSTLVRAERLATLGTMAAAVSHEMRNALAILRSSISEIDSLMDSAARRPTPSSSSCSRPAKRASPATSPACSAWRARSPRPGRRSMSPTSRATSCRCCAMSGSRAGSRSGSRSITRRRAWSGIAARSNRC